jgi:hypothetical protein
MDVLLQALGFGLGAAVYVVLALVALSAARTVGRGAVALYWARRERRETKAAVRRIYDVQQEAPAATARRRRAAA